MNPQQGRDRSVLSTENSTIAAAPTTDEGGSSAPAATTTEATKIHQTGDPILQTALSNSPFAAGGSISSPPGGTQGPKTRDILVQLAFSDIFADSCDCSRVQVGNVDPACSNENLSALFGQFGEIKCISPSRDSSAMRIVTFFDSRSARKVCQQPPGSFVLNGQLLSVCYAASEGSDFECDDSDESTLRVYGIPPVVSNGDMFRVFGRFGDVKDIREVEQDDLGRRCHIVEYFDQRSSQNATECLNNAELFGSRLAVDAFRSLPLWQRRRRRQQTQMPRQTQQAFRKNAQSWEQVRCGDHSPELGHTRAVQYGVMSPPRVGEPGSCPSTTSTVSAASTGVFSPPLLESMDPSQRERMLQTGSQKPRRLMSPISFPDAATNSVPILPSMSNFDFNYSPMTTSTVTPPHVLTFDSNRSTFSPGPVPARNRVSSASMTNLIQRPPAEQPVRSQFFSPTSFHSISGSIHGSATPSQVPSSGGRYHEFSSGSSSPGTSCSQRRQSGGSGSGRTGYQPSGSLAPRRGPLDTRQDYYSIVIIGGRVLDSRTTLMIRNIPNKYTQRMLIEQLDRENPGCYDFLYLPIDFKNNCNVGYAFVNMVSTDFLPAFYATLHNKRWERFNSEKVCEIAYARIQGLEQLLDHFKNSSLLAEDKKVRPVILLNGHYVPFPDPDVVIRVASSGSHKFLVTFVIVYIRFCALFFPPLMIVLFCLTVTTPHIYKILLQSFFTVMLDFKLSSQVNRFSLIHIYIKESCNLLYVYFFFLSLSFRYMYCMITEVFQTK